MNLEKLKAKINAYPKHTAIRFSFDGRSESYLIETFHKFVADHTRLQAKNAAMREALEGIRDMPDYDQDNEHRLRNVARSVLDEIGNGEGE